MESTSELKCKNYFEHKLFVKTIWILATVQCTAQCTMRREKLYSNAFCSFLFYKNPFFSLLKYGNAMRVRAIRNITVIMIIIFAVAENNLQWDAVYYTLAKRCATHFILIYDIAIINHFSIFFTSGFVPFFLYLKFEIFNECVDFWNK